MKPPVRIIDKNPPLGFSIWENRIRSRVMEAPHTHTDVEINILHQGRLTYIHAGKSYFVTAAQTAVFWAGVPHQLLEAEKDPYGIWVTLPLQWILEWKLPSRLIQSLLSGEMILSSRDRALIPWELAQRWENDFSTGNPESIEASLLEIRAHLIRLASGEDHPPPLTSSVPPHGKPPTHKLERGLLFIAEHYQQPIQVSDIAEALGLHPNYLQQSFRQLTGFPLWDYVTRLRLAHAQRLLLTTADNILEIALESGFGSQSSFYRAFQSSTGQSPARFRKNHRQL